MEYLPITLKTLHLGVAGLGLYVSIEGQDKLYVGDAATFNTINSTGNLFKKDDFMTAAYIVTIVACLQLAALYYFHNFKGKESHFRLAYFTFAIINLVFGAILLQGAVSLLSPTTATDGGGTVTPIVAVTGKDHEIAVAGAVLGALVVAFNFVNLYHAGHAMVRSTGVRGRGSPRRK